jgi:diguanylate cyclase
MYCVKESGKNSYQFFNPGMDERIQRKVEIERKLRKALPSGQLDIYYQPKLNAETGIIVGVEALCRWNDPVEGWISPSEFIPLAEEIGLIVPLGRWVLEKSCRQNKEWQEKGLFVVPVSVNLSVQQLKEKNLVSTVYEILQTTRLDPSLLEVEITENLSLHGVEEILPRLYELKQLGIKISMDDFGTGYSSLSYLRKYPIDTVKIDQSFVRNYTREAPVIDAILDLAKRLGLEVIAEGVETREQQLFLMERGCNLMQGYLFSRPILM